MSRGRRGDIELDVGQAGRLRYLVMNGTNVGIWVGLGDVELEVSDLSIEVGLGWLVSYM